MTTRFKILAYAALLLAALPLTFSEARADTITLFDISGAQLDDGATLSGTLTIDTTIGWVTAANVQVGAPESYTATSIVLQEPGAISGSPFDDYLLGLESNDNQHQLNLYFGNGTIFNPATLVGYSGGGFSDATSSFIPPFDGPSSRLQFPGSITPVPEPSTLALMGIVAIGWPIALLRNRLPHAGN